MNIDNTVRRYVFSTAILQEVLIDCCCDGHQPPPPPQKVPVKVTTVSPPNGSQFTTTEFVGGNAPGAAVLTFDKRLNPSTVSGNILVTQSLGGQTPQPIAGVASYDDGQMQVTFTPTQGFPGDASGAVYTVIARGSGATPLKDLDALALDGNGDGTAGDDFSSSFTVNFEIG